MSGYKCVNYYDLCRLCTTSSGTRINIYSEDGKKKNLSQKIFECLPVTVDEKDNLPKIICETCVAQIESICEFRTVCLNSQAMLEGCINTATLQNGGKIYIKEGGMTLKNISATLQNGGNIYIKEDGTTFKNISVSSNNAATANQTSAISQPNSDFLSSIIQAVGIQNEDIQDVKTTNPPHYTITVDGKTLASNQIEYKVQEVPASSVTQIVQQQSQNENSERNFRNNSLAEFLKMKPNIRVTPIKKKQPSQIQQSTSSTKIAKIETLQTESQQVAVQTDNLKKNNSITKPKKQKYNLVLTSPTAKQQHNTSPQVISQQQIVPAQQSHHLSTISTQHPQSTTTIVPTSTVHSAIGTKSLTVPDFKLISAPSSKCFLPLTIKDSSNNDQQIVAQIDTKNLILPATYQLQMKLQPQLTIDGQQIVQLTPSAIPATISLAPSQAVTQTFQDHHIVTTSGIDAATSTNESEMMLNGNHITNNQHSSINVQSANLNIQQIQTIPSSAVSLPQLQIKNISATSAQTNNHTTHQVAPQKLFNNSITVHRITNAAATLQQHKQQTATVQHQQILQQTQQSIQQKQVQQQSGHQKQQQVFVQHHQQQPSQPHKQTQQQPHKQQHQTQQHKQQHQQHQQQQPQQQQQLSQSNQPPTQIQYIQRSGITKVKPVKLIRTTKLTPAQAKQVAAQQIANKKVTVVATPSIQSTQKPQSNMIITHKLPIRKTQTTNTTQFPPLPTLSTTQSLPQQQFKPQSQHQQQQHQQQQQQHQHQQQQSQQQPRVNNNVKKAVPVKTTNSALAHTTPSAAAALATVNPFTNLLECSVCSRGFKKKEHLAQHMKLHAGLRPFKCSEPGCTKAFSRKEHLMRHIVSHTGKKMFSCDMCQKFFSRKDNLNKHKRTHSEQSSNSGNGQYVCDVCNKSFVVKMYYLQHKLLHEKNEQQKNVNSKSEESDDQNIPTTTSSSTTVTSNSIKFETNNATQLSTSNIEVINNQIKLEPQSPLQHLQQRQQQKNQTQLVQLQLPVATSNNFNGGTITISQADGTTTTLKTLGNHDATVLNLPTSLANYMQLNSAQFITTSGEIVGHIKIEK